ncbi:MAG TPA: 50S ribosomal protein L3 [candidate division Zixibacteria bacterium]|nr:50S ribosomal protein L3 [candidate division Zixibacteria bacterium]
MKEILGKKIGSTRIFNETGEAIPVTVIQAGPCPVVARKTVEKDGYEAYQVGFGQRRKSRINKPTEGHFKTVGVQPTQYLREVRITDGDYEPGTTITVNLFQAGERVDVSGVSRGLGFAGGMKRHHFQGANKTHGQSDRWRAPGSIGQSSYPSRVFKGTRMAGRLGKDKVTVLNLEIVKIIEDENLMLVKGSVPGFRGGLLKIRSTNRGK